MDYKYCTDNLVWSIGKVSYKNICKLLQQKGLVVWFTGISGAGKSTITIEVERELTSHGRLSYRLDGDNIRQGLCSDEHPDKLPAVVTMRDDSVEKVTTVIDMGLYAIKLNDTIIQLTVVS